MWKRFHKTLCCPLCRHSLELAVFDEAACSLDEKDIAHAKELRLFDDDFNRYVNDGVLLCSSCTTYFPIYNGLPVLLSYTTPLHKEFAGRFKDRLRSNGLQNRCFPSGEPVEGEQFVLNSFSKEWGDYNYDGVLWDATYQDLERRVLLEIGLPDELQNSTFLEVGCGIGVTTNLIQKNYGGDAVGVDLSHSVFQASHHFRNNPFLHFVQASVFHLPFRKQSFAAVYSRGALHHTFSTCEAVKALGDYCREGGLLYLWVYGTDSIADNWFRKILYRVEKKVRPFISENPDSRTATVFLNSMAVGYIVYNKLRRLKDKKVQNYTFGRAVHAARDRFTPRFAHRHHVTEVLSWFNELGFAKMEVVDWKVMPSVEQDDYRRNIGVRAKRLMTRRA
jgi:SAM-dependent methyltransferase/uncharacterized protein YbaR (Trm112 family)